MTTPPKLYPPMTEPQWVFSARAETDQDGDTVTLLLRGPIGGRVSWPIRLLGINTPEDTAGRPAAAFVVNWLQEAEAAAVGTAWERWPLVVETQVRPTTVRLLTGQRVKDVRESATFLRVLGWLWRRFPDGENLSERLERDGLGVRVAF